MLCSDHEYIIRIAVYRNLSIGTLLPGQLHHKEYLPEGTNGLGCLQAQHVRGQELYLGGLNRSVHK